jgi:hypothetical protein
LWGGLDTQRILACLDDTRCAPATCCPQAVLAAVMDVPVPGLKNLKHEWDCSTLLSSNHAVHPEAQGAAP